MRHTETTTQPLNGIQMGAIAVGVIGIVLSIIGAAADADHFIHVYLVAFLFWINISLGCLAIMMIPNLASARWSLAVQRIAIAGARTLPLMAVLFFPLLLGMESLYPWAEEGAESSNYLTVAFFIVRALIYFVVWLALTYFLSEWSYRSDDAYDEDTERRIHLTSIIGMILFFLTSTFAAFDWSMSLEGAEFFSSIYGWLVISSQGLSAIAFVIIVLSFFWDREPLADLVEDRVIGDLGALLLVSLMGWIYLSFMQYIVIWSGNVASKAVWFDTRTAGEWATYATFIIVIHAVVFLMLLAPGLKRIKAMLVMMASILLVSRLFYEYWVVMPTLSSDFTLEWWDFALPIGMGGLWVALFLWSLRGSRILPVNHPGLVAHEEEETYETA